MYIFFLETRKSKLYKRQIFFEKMMDEVYLGSREVEKEWIGNMLPPMIEWVGNMLPPMILQVHTFANSL